MFAFPFVKLKTKYTMKRILAVYVLYILILLAVSIGCFVGVSTDRCNDTALYTASFFCLYLIVRVLLSISNLKFAHSEYLRFKRFYVIDVLKRSGLTSLRVAATLGHNEAQCKIGELYSNGDDFVRKDIEQGEEWLNKGKKGKKRWLHLFILGVLIFVAVLGFLGYIIPKL